MERTIYNPQKARLETVPIEFTDANTTWFNESRNDHDICSITDFDGGLVISVCGYDYPVWVYGVTRTSIGYNRNRAFKLRKSYLRGSRSSKPSPPPDGRDLWSPYGLPPVPAIRAVQTEDFSNGIKVLKETDKLKP